MATKMLESSALSAFCESLAIMLSAGIQTDEAVHLLSDSMEDSDFKRACDETYRQLIAGKSLANAMNTTGAFPPHVINMVSAGEFSGRLENVLASLAKYYDEEARLFTKIRSAITYPAALLAIMCVILLFTSAIILPVFIDVYRSLTGDLATSSYSFVNISILIGWIAFGITVFCTLVVIIGMGLARTQKGRIRLLSLFEHLPVTKGPMRQMALGRFTSALATYVASGVDTNTAMREAADMVDHANLKREIAVAQRQMEDIDQAKSLAQAIYDNSIYEPVYARMLIIGTRSGSIEAVLARLSDTFFDDSIIQV
ncbi:MAG: type II secretion system F family protein, partial [Raoultibacter sp.]